ncbi:IQ domain-containing protein iqm6 [Orobanche gracilis]
MILRGSLSFQGRDMDTMADPPAICFKNSTNAPDKNNNVPMAPADVMSRHQAALKLQKTYKSFRTRRQLADCAVLVEQRWWKLLDFAELKRSSISFFEIEKPQTAMSRWSRARTRAAKVGKGLSKDEKARKLALQHWLEAIDPRHRYGHNLQFYYANWLQCDSRQPFFYWLDIGEGREVNLERCPRSKLQQQCIKYLGPTERSAYEIIITEGKLLYKQSGKPLDTRGGTEDDVKWIFVLSVSKILYVGQKKKGTFQHSSFLAGGATLSAGRLVVEDGILKAVWPHSGHYLPTEENFEEFMAFLLQHNVDLSVVQRAPGNEEEEVNAAGLRNSISVPDLRHGNSRNEYGDQLSQKKYSSKEAENIHLPPVVLRYSKKLHSRIGLLKIPERGENSSELFFTPKPGGSPLSSLESPEADGYETADEYLSDSEFSVSKQNLFDQDVEEEYEEPIIPREKIIKRINSHKGMKSYQLANQLSCRWTTGAGPRIGCVRDYPSELQLRVLEEVSLSPKSAFSSPRRYVRPTASALSTPTRERSSFAVPSPNVPKN